jgi:hypothetical protein
MGTLVDGTYERKKTRHEGNGGIKFGTESNGGFKNINISNCIFDKCAGFSLEIVDGGTIENVNITGIVMRDITSSPIFIRLGDRRRGPEGTKVGAVRKISISDVTVIGEYPENLCRAKAASHITGLKGFPVEDVRLSNISILVDGGGTPEDAELEPKENEKEYPRSDMFGVLPAYGFYFRHVKGLELHDITVSYKKPDLRHAMFCDDVNGLELDNVKFQYAADGAEPIRLRNVENLYVHGCRDYTQKALERSIKREDVK